MLILKCRSQQSFSFKKGIPLELMCRKPESTKDDGFF